jgi:hypothetical protein
MEKKDKAIILSLTHVMTGLLQFNIINKDQAMAMVPENIKKNLDFFNLNDEELIEEITEILQSYKDYDFSCEEKEKNAENNSN